LIVKIKTYSTLNKHSVCNPARFCKFSNIQRTKTPQVPFQFLNRFLLRLVKCLKNTRLSVIVQLYNRQFFFYIITKKHLLRVS